MARHTKRADQLKPGDRIRLWSDIYTVERSGLAPDVHSVRLYLWDPDLGTRPTDFPRDHMFTLVTK